MEAYLPEAYALNVLRPRIENPDFFPRDNAPESFIQSLGILLSSKSLPNNTKEFLQDLEIVRIPTIVKFAIKTYIQCMSLVSEYYSKKPDSMKIFQIIQEIEDKNIHKNSFYEEALTILLHEIISVHSLDVLSDYARLLEMLDSKEKKIVEDSLFIQVASSIEITDNLINMARQLKCFINLIKVNGCSVLLKSLAQKFFILLENDEIIKALPESLTTGSSAFNNYNKQEINKALKMIGEVPFDDIIKEKYQRYCQLYNVAEKKNIQELEAQDSSKLDTATIALTGLDANEADLLLNLPIISWEQIKEINTIVSLPNKKPAIKISRCEIIIDEKPLLVAVKTYSMKKKDKSLELQAGYMTKMQGCIYFLKLYGSFWSIGGNSYNYNLVMELAKESLKQRIQSWEAHGKDSTFRQEQALIALKALVSGMNELTNRNIAHRDIKPDNILITENSIYKIMDLDISKQFSRDGYGITCTADAKYEGTKDYMSPELRSLESRPKTAEINYNKSDVYSLGLTIMRMVTSDGEGAYCIKHETLESDIGRHLDRFITNGTLKHYLIQMLKVDPSERPRFHELYAELSLGDKTED